MRARYQRLSPMDQMYLMFEDARTTTHFGALLVLEGAPLLDAAGHPRLEELRLRLGRRARRVPSLRKVLYRPGPLQGPPLWVDAPTFAVERHILQAEIPAPGGEAELLRLAAQLFGRRLERSIPLWELWFLTGLESGRLAALLKLHHSIADGQMALRIFSALFDLAPDAADPEEEPWSPQPPPSRWQLFVDNLATKGMGMVRALKRLTHPVALGRSAVSAGRALVRVLRDNRVAPRTSLNVPLRGSRRLAVMRMGLAEAKDIAHARGARLNDLMLALITGGARELLLHRGEPVEGVALIASVAVSLRPEPGAGEMGNQTGPITVPLPLDSPEPEAYLEAISASTRVMKKKEVAASTEHVISWMTQLGPLLRFISRRQHTLNLFETNVAGPPVPLFMLGARILDVTIAISLQGNVGLSFAVLSYAGQLNLSVSADGEWFPDLPVLMTGMEKSWARLSELPEGKPTPTPLDAGYRPPPP